MNLSKITLLLSILIIFNLVGCSEPVSNTTDSKAQVIERLKLNNNWLLEVEKKQLVNTPLPFNEQYLETRHQLYKQLQQFAHSPLIQKQLEYLIIEERFAERFYPWPPIVNVLLPLLKNQRGSEFELLNSKAQHWLEFVENTLMQNRNDRLTLNRIELSQLNDFAATILQQLEITNDVQQSTSQLKEQLVHFNAFLSNYRPRSALSISQQPNGSSWYQAKLNYYSGYSKSPNHWLNSIVSALNEGPESQLIKWSQFFSHQKNGLSINELLHFFNAPITHEGLDWRTNYVDVVAAFKEINITSLTPAHRKVALVLANVDLGIHYQSWSYQHAEQFLMSELEFDQQHAKSVIQFIVLQPAVLMAPAAHLYL